MMKVVFKSIENMWSDVDVKMTLLKSHATAGKTLNIPHDITWITRLNCQFNLNVKYKPEKASMNNLTNIRDNL